MWVISVRGGRLRGERGGERSQCRSSIRYLCVGVNWRKQSVLKKQAENHSQA